MLFRKKKTYEDLSELVAACQQGDARAQQVFYERYKGKMMRVCQRYTRTTSEAEDIFQEAFIKIFREIKNLENPNAADSWVKVVTVRTAVSHYRSERNERAQVAIGQDHLELETQDYERILASIDLNVLLGIITGLPGGYRTVINLFLIDGYSHEEIAQMLSITPGTSKSQLYKGRNLLIKRLEDQKIINHETFGGRY
jgi:RNA polymerase sigma factor (sigma-70 family)